MLPAVGEVDSIVDTPGSTWLLKIHVFPQIGVRTRFEVTSEGRGVFKDDGPWRRIVDRHSGGKITLHAYQLIEHRIIYN